MLSSETDGMKNKKKHTKQTTKKQQHTKNQTYYSI